MLLPMKRYFTDGLVQIAIVLSLLRIDLDIYGDMDDIFVPAYGEARVGGMSLYASARHRGGGAIDGYAAHPKSVDRDASPMLRELQRLGAYERFRAPLPMQNDFVALLLNVPENLTEAGGGGAGGTPQEESVPAQPTAAQDDDGGNHDDGSREATALGAVSPNSDLTKEDMDLIEILWRQDIDLGAPRDVFDPTLRMEQRKKEADSNNNNNNNETAIPSDPWSGLQYYRDGETGEYVMLPPQQQQQAPSAAQPADSRHTDVDEPPTADADSVTLQTPEVADAVVPLPPAAALLSDRQPYSDLGASAPQQQQPLEYSGPMQDVMEIGALQTQEHRTRGDSESTRASEVSHSDYESTVSPADEQDGYAFGFDLDLDLEELTNNLNLDTCNMTTVAQFDNYIQSGQRLLNGSVGDQVQPAAFTRLSSIEQRWEDVASVLELDAGALRATATWPTNFSGAAGSAPIQPSDVLLQNVTLASRLSRY
ncbi:PREDICTED: nuclear factor erythroid 2-related factor 1-like isoform X2 [Priapulus caudatus]|uniref:Nuclear factor erythroid 2-related factor 1-like isoform X2 n=1 Tax=Priapulus caudatus TaxID=37621 RepID=A0ABM1F2E2_PRICU|nr:PREDICTED: nuclear factor erythroid 2-related factor 1-like isoform X2 [Priapulus caudatus]